MIEGLALLFVFGTFWFWLLVAAASIAIITFLEYDRTVSATFTLIATTAAIVFLGNHEVIPWLFNHPYHLVGYIGIYFATAIIWCFIKWKLYVHKIKDFIHDSMQKWILDLSGRLENSMLTDQQKKDYEASVKARKLVGICNIEWNKYVDDWEKRRRERLRNRSSYWDIPLPLRTPTTKDEVIAFVEDNKSRVISWMVYCPWSIVWTLLNDPIRKLMKYIFKRIKGWLVSIAMSAFGVKEQEEAPVTIPLPPPPPLKRSAAPHAAREEASDSTV